jgi:ribosomal protein S18 acetylase RimI-like enzyme
MSITEATIEDLDDLVPLFDAYRQFYKQPSDLAAARAFLLERFEHQQSVIFIARDDSGAPVGFTQLYPSFSSTSLRRIYVLNDLYVRPELRGQHVGVALLEAAAVYGRKTGAARLTLRTATDNLRAQGVYEGAGWRRDDAFLTYDLPL